MKALLVHNPNAGAEPVGKEPLIALLNSEGIQVDYKEHGSDDIADWLDRNTDLVVVAGGDGTVAEVMIALRRRSVPLLLVPLGGSNNIARGFGIAGTPESLITGMGATRKAQFHICEAQFTGGSQCFVEAAGLGALTRTVETADFDYDTVAEKLARGQAAFRDQLREAAPFACTVQIDGAKITGEWLMVEALRTPMVGPRLPLAAASSPEDPRLHVLLVRPDDREAMLDWAQRLEGPPPAETRHGAVVTFDGVEGPLRLDDECIPITARYDVRLTIAEQPVTVLLPQSPETQ